MKNFLCWLGFHPTPYKEIHADTHWYQEYDKVIFKCKKCDRTVKTKRIKKSPIPQDRA